MEIELVFDQMQTPIVNLVALYLLRFLPCLLLGLISGYVTKRYWPEASARPSERAARPAETKSAARPRASTSASDTLVYGALPLPKTAVDLPLPQKTQASGAKEAALLEKFQQAVLHDFINRLRNRFPDEPQRFLKRLQGEQMVADLNDYLARLIPKHDATLALRPETFGLAESLSQWKVKLRILQDFLDFSQGKIVAEMSNNECAHWTSKLEELVLYLEKLQEAIIKNVSRFSVDLADLLDEVDALYPEVRLSVGLALTIRHEGGDELHDSLKAVFCNLCDNALNARAKEIVITAKRDKEKGLLAITVSDDGAGLPDPSASHLFLTGVGQGSGTGLSKVRKIIKKVGGTVGVGEPVDGKGASFVLTLPRKVGEVK